ncbi:hypothetical protein DFH09DRAFT_1365674 [Mycena vulgaris]|nr:hypothetical protein DFH09DRAFT_1365674 [Mycena vulgaris]
MPSLLTFFLIAGFIQLLMASALHGDIVSPFTYRFYNTDVTGGCNHTALPASTSPPNDEPPAPAVNFGRCINIPTPLGSWAWLEASRANLNFFLYCTFTCSDLPIFTVGDEGTCNNFPVGAGAGCVPQAFIAATKPKGST